MLQGTVTIYEHALLPAVSVVSCVFGKPISSFFRPSKNTKLGSCQSRLSQNAIILRPLALPVMYFFMIKINSISLIDVSAVVRPFQTFQDQKHFGIGHLQCFQVLQQIFATPKPPRKYKDSARRYCEGTGYPWRSSNQCST